MGAIAAVPSTYSNYDIIILYTLIGWSCFFLFFFSCENYYRTLREQRPRDKLDNFTDRAVRNRVHTPETVLSHAVFYTVAYRYYTWPETKYRNLRVSKSQYETNNNSERTR